MRAICAVEVVEDGERVGALDPRVVGDLVVGEEGRVDDGAAGEDVADHRGDLQVALDTVAQARTSA